jgi:hypothetical protein
MRLASSSSADLHVPDACRSNNWTKKELARRVFIRIHRIIGDVYPREQDRIAALSKYGTHRPATGLFTLRPVFKDLCETVAFGVRALGDMPAHACHTTMPHVLVCNSHACMPAMQQPQQHPACHPSCTLLSTALPASGVILLAATRYTLPYPGPG